jgi:hypothetical protein
MVSTMAYSVFVTGVLGIQIYCAWVLLRVMDAPNFVFTGKLSLLTLSLCNIEDFSQTMTHIQYIMGSEVLLRSLRAATSSSSCPPSPIFCSSSSST